MFLLKHYYSVSRIIHFSLLSAILKYILFFAIFVYEAFAFAFNRICEATNFVLNKDSRDSSTPLS